MDLGQPSDMSPNQSFRVENQPQFQSQFSYPQVTSSFAIDQDMNMGAESFAAGVQAHTAAPIDSRAGETAAGQNSNAMNASPTTISAPGMAPPPQNSSNPYSPGGPRPSIDDGQDGGISGGDQKRKRSKVSRACDECRRKKVRCDAAAEDGTIKTCSNCARASLTCEYSRVPMKRGPSKGYIKELSERVQQVESIQMALSNTPGYRQSLDATAPAAYAEQPYSPDDPMSLKRNFSFSADQRSPFGGPEYNRDRMPSLGGWNSSSPYSTSLKTRDRGSIAIAPDQLSTNTSSFVKPFWVHDHESSPPTKRQKMDSDGPRKPDLGQDFLAQYYRDFHLNLPVLPDADTSIAIIQKAQSKVQHAFVATVRHLSSHSSLLQNGTEPGAGAAEAPSTASDMYTSRQELEKFMWSTAQESPESRTPEDNLLSLWIFLLLAVEAENDLTRLHDGTLPRTVLIKHAVDLGWYCVTSSSRQGSELGAGPKSPYLEDFARAWHCATVLARLHALAVGSGNPIPTYFQQKGVPTILQVLPPTAAIVAFAASLLTTVSLVVQDPLPPSQWGHNLDMRHRVVIQEQFDCSIASRFEATENETLVEHLKLFVDLLLSRYTLNFHPFDIVIPAAELAEVLLKHTIATKDSNIYNPFQLHFFSLVTITLLEFLQEDSDTEIHKMARSGVQAVRRALEQISEKEAAEQQRDGDRTKDVSTKEHVHWADVLLRMIEDRYKDVPPATANGGENGGVGSKRNVGLGNAAALDFSLLLRHGYLNVLARYAS